MTYRIIHKARTHHNTRNPDGTQATRYSPYELGMIMGERREILAVIVDTAGFDGLGFDSGVGGSDDHWHAFNVFKNGHYADTLAVGGALDNDHALEVARSQMDHLGGNSCIMIVGNSVQFDSASHNSDTWSIDAFSKLMNNPSQDQDFLPLITAAELNEESMRVCFDSAIWGEGVDLKSHGAKVSRLHLDMVRADSRHQLTDPFNLAEELANLNATRLDESAFDALMDTESRLGLLKDRLFSAMSKASIDGLAVQNVTQTKPFKRQGVANIAFVFELSDGQTVSIWFHNPDTTPSKLMPSDIMISWKWLLNKRDVTAALSPKQGDNVQLPTLARRIMLVASKNSKRFKATQARTAKAQQELIDTQADIDQKNATINQLDVDISELNSKISAALKTPNVNIVTDANGTTKATKVEFTDKGEITTEYGPRENGIPESVTMTFAGESGRINIPPKAAKSTTKGKTYLPVEHGEGGSYIAYMNTKKKDHWQAIPGSDGRFTVYAENAASSGRAIPKVFDNVADLVARYPAFAGIEALIAENDAKAAIDAKPATNAVPGNKLHLGTDANGEPITYKQASESTELLDEYGRDMQDMLDMREDDVITILLENMGWDKASELTHTANDNEYSKNGHILSVTTVKNDKPSGSNSQTNFYNDALVWELTTSDFNYKDLLEIDDNTMAQKINKAARGEVTKTDNANAEIFAQDFFMRNKRIKNVLGFTDNDVEMDSNGVYDVLAGSFKGKTLKFTDTVCKLVNACHLIGADIVISDFTSTAYQDSMFDNAIQPIFDGLNSQSKPTYGITAQISIDGNMIRASVDEKGDCQLLQGSSGETVISKIDFTPADNSTAYQAKLSQALMNEGNKMNEPTGKNEDMSKKTESTGSKIKHIGNGQYITAKKDNNNLTLKAANYENEWVVTTHAKGSINFPLEQFRIKSFNSISEMIIDYPEFKGIETIAGKHDYNVYFGNNFESIDYQEALKSQDFIDKYIDDINHMLEIRIGRVQYLLVNMGWERQSVNWGAGDPLFKKGHLLFDKKSIGDISPSDDVSPYTGTILRWNFSTTDFTYQDMLTLTDVEMAKMLDDESKKAVKYPVTLNDESKPIPDQVNGTLADRIQVIQGIVDNAAFEPSDIDNDELIALVDETEGDPILSAQIDAILSTYQDKLVAISMKALSSLAGN